MQIKNGLASVTSASATVTGSGTTWLADVSIGDYFIKAGDALPIVYTVGGIVSDTQLTLTAPYGGSTESGIAYVVHRDFFPNGNAQLFSTDVETAGIFNESAKSSVLSDELGTAATADVTTSNTDTAAGAVKNNTDYPSYIWPITNNSSANSEYWHCVLTINNTVSAKRLKVSITGGRGYGTNEVENSSSEIVVTVNTGGTLSVTAYNRTSDGSLPIIIGIRSVDNGDNTHSVWIQLWSYTSAIAESFGNASFTPVTETSQAGTPSGTVHNVYNDWHSGNLADPAKLSATQTFTAANTFNAPVVAGASPIVVSGAELQVNGFMRTGNVYVHEGGNTPTIENLAISNVNGDLAWDDDVLWHGGNLANGENKAVGAEAVLGWGVAYLTTAFALLPAINLLVRPTSSIKAGTFKLQTLGGVNVVTGITTSQISLSTFSSGPRLAIWNITGLSGLTVDTPYRLKAETNDAELTVI